MAKFVVWRRNDGYVGASACYCPRNYVTGGVYETYKESEERRKKGLPLEGAGIPVTFEAIADFDNWDEARKRIEVEQGNSDLNRIAHRTQLLVRLSN